MSKAFYLNNYEIKFVSWEEVVKLTTLSEEYIFDLLEQGKFPVPVKLTGIDEAFVLSEITQWQIERMNLREHSY